MKNLVVINAIKLSSYAFKPLRDGGSAFSRCLDFARSLPEVGEWVILAPSSLSLPGTEIKTAVRTDWDTKGMLEELKALSDGYDHIFYFFADCPLLDLNLARRMYQNHLRYFADYTFADGYPYGLALEILKAPVVEALLKLVKDGEAVKRDSIFETIKKDINAFDIETEIAPVDLRLLRLSLTADCKRNFLLLERLLGLGATDEESVCRLIQERPELLRTLPAYFPIQIVAGCRQSCSYCPYPLLEPGLLTNKREMPKEKFFEVIEKIEAFCDDAVISVSLWGEPSLHSAIDELLGFVLKRPAMEMVVETAGLGWDEKRLEKLAGELERKPAFIISLDAHQPELYGKLRGKGFNEALPTARLFLRLFPATTYVQAVRMQENEEALEGFYRDWKKETENIIIQKYDHFCRFLPQRKVTDLSPLKRQSCWHLKRDFVVLLDGSVPMCREDLKQAHLLGNVFQMGLDEIWQQGEQYYKRHLAEDYPELCQDCDEYYTYNF